MSVVPEDRVDQQNRLQRILVIGTSGAGKSTLASRLACLLGVPPVELDSLHWGEQWTPVEAGTFRERVVAATSGEKWVVDGNYSAVKDLIWPKATCIIWLDYPFCLVLWRVIRRTFIRVVRGEPCCNGNYETFRIALSLDSVIWWVVTTFHQRRREFAALLPSFVTPDRSVIVFQNPKQTSQWLQRVGTECSARSQSSLHGSSVESSSW